MPRAALPVAAPSRFGHRAERVSWPAPVPQDGEAPVQKIKLRHGDVLVVDTLEGNVRLSALRRFLAEGFQAHLYSNPLLHEVFRFKPRYEAADRLTALEKRMFR